MIASFGEDMKRLMANPELARSLGQAGRQGGGREFQLAAQN